MCRNTRQMVPSHRITQCQQPIARICLIEVFHRVTIIGIAVERSAPHGKALLIYIKLLPSILLSFFRSFGPKNGAGTFLFGGKMIEYSCTNKII